MCNSQAEGGQRCHGHAATALTAAEGKYQEYTEAIQHQRDTGSTPSQKARVLQLEAKFFRADALARYASTPQGEDDLNRKLETLCQANRTQVSDPLQGDYAQAITEGRKLRARAQEVHDAVKNGTMGPRTAERIVAYPTYETREERTRAISAIPGARMDGSDPSWAAECAPRGSSNPTRWFSP